MIRRKNNSVEKTKLEKRVESLQTADLTQWIDQTLYVIGKNVTAWNRTQQVEMLSEAEIGAEALVAVIKELIKRSK